MVKKLHKKASKPKSKAREVSVKSAQSSTHQDTEDQEQSSHRRARSTPNTFTHKKEKEFLEHLASGLTVSDAASAIGISRVTIYERRKTNEEFAAAWEEAYEQGTDELEKEAERRAVYGIEEDVWHKGEKVGKQRKYSDVLLIFLLKGRRPRKFRDNVDITSGGESMGTALKQFADVIRSGAARLKDE